MFFRPTRLSIDLSALENNFLRIREIVGKDRRICAVVKANAYGIGAVDVARRLESLGCDYFGVAMVEEALELRRAGLETPVIILGPLGAPEAAEVALKNNFEISIHHLPNLDDLAGFSRDSISRLKIHLKIDTGMSRLGVQPREISSWCGGAAKLGLSLSGAFTTLSSSDQQDSPRTSEQLKLFRDTLDELKRNGFDPPLRHAANSGAIMHFPNSLLNMVRPGLLLHGIPSNPNGKVEGFRTVAQLQSKVVQTSALKRGATVGYSGSFRTERNAIVAVVPIGYADGLNRLLSNNGDVLIKGRRAPIIGRISMDLATVDVTDLEDVKPGDEVTIIGTDGDEEITAWELSRRLGTIPWELFCWIGPRVPRHYHEAGRSLAE